MTKRIRKQSDMLFFSLSQMVLKHTAVSGPAMLHAERNIVKLKDGSDMDISMKGISESRVIRKFGADNFAVITVDEEAQPLMLDYLLLDGFMFEGKCYKRVLRSAAQMRTAKAVFTCLDVDMVREEMVYGATFTKNGKVNIAKKEARYGLALSSTMEVNTKFTHAVIPDFFRTVELEGRKMSETGIMKDFKEDVALNFTDGQGYIDYPTAKSISKELGLNYVPTAFQVRFAGSKGLLITWKWDKAQHPENILFHDSMWKYDPDFSKYQPKLEIADWAKPARSQYVQMSYQFLQVLNITGDDLIAMAQETLDRIDAGVLTKPEVAMKFLGMIDTSEGVYNDKIVSRLQKTLDANPKMLSDAYVQRQVRKLLKKFVTDMRTGRVPVLGAWRYVIADPAVAFGNTPELTDGQVYYNNQDGTIAAFRSPLIHSSEAATFEMTAVSPYANMKEKGGFTYLQDLLVLNTFDDACPRMGGMDKDGDRVLMTADERIINAVRGGALIYDEGRDGELVKDTRENAIAYDRMTFSPSRIGFITDWATIWIDACHHKGEFAKWDENVQMLRILQGQEIDSAKTGYIPEIPKHLQLKVSPHWMEKSIDSETGKTKVTAYEGPKVYRSTSPMGKLYDFIVGTSNEMLSKEDDIYRKDGYWAKFSEGNPKLEEKRSLEILMSIDRMEATQVYSYLSSLEKMYRSELAALRDVRHLDTEDMEDMRNRVFEKYSALVSAIDADPATVAGVAYQIAYNDNGSQKRSISFPWICGFDGLLMTLIGIADKRYKLVKVSGKNLSAGQITFASKKSKSGAVASVPNGTYDVVEIEGRFYAQVKRTALPKATPLAKRGEKVAFTIRGFKHYGVTATQAMQLVRENNNELLLVQQENFINVYTGDQCIASVATEDDFTMSMVMNRRLRLTNIPETKFESQRTHRMEERGQLDLQADVIEEVELIESDLNSAFDEEFKRFGFEAVKSELFNEIDEDGAIGRLLIRFNERAYAYRFASDGGIPVIITPIKSDDVRGTLTKYLQASYEFIA